MPTHIKGSNCNLSAIDRRTAAIHPSQEEKLTSYGQTRHLQHVTTVAAVVLS
jgi:hypothetical protein